VVRTVTSSRLTGLEEVRKGATAGVRSLRLAALTLLVFAVMTSTAAGQGREDFARGQVATASSSQEPGEYANVLPCACSPDQAVDGSSTTLWSSDWIDKQWWQVDLGRPRMVDTVYINWSGPTRGGM
jgi:hypothetical protein